MTATLAARHDRLVALLDADPVIAILRGLPPGATAAMGEALIAAGVTVAEVPLNGPDPLAAIARLAEAGQGRLMVGAGTVLDPEDVVRVAAAGAEFIVSPNTDAAVIAAAIAHGLVPMPGFRTPSEAFAAIAAGARWLKVFPASDAEGEIAALGAVLPKDVRLIGVGGAGAANARVLLDAGCAAIGVGSEVYRPGADPALVRGRAAAVVAATRPPAAPQVTLAARADAAIGEGPLWLDGRLVWVDPLSARLLSAHPGDAEARELPLATPLWALGLAPDGGVVAAGSDCLALLDPDTGAVRPHPVALGPGCRLNDIAVDARGGVWAGSMHRGLLSGRGAIHHAAAPDAPMRCVAEGLGVPNGMAFDAAGETLFVVDTLARTLLAYPADTAAGMLGEPVVVSDLGGAAGKPDGLAIAPDGHLWLAMWGGGCVVEIAPNGAVLRSIAIPAPQVSSLCWADGALIITTSRMRLSPAQLAAHPLSGSAFRVVP